MEKYLDIPDCGIDKVAPATLPLFLGQDTGCSQVHICMLGSDYVPFACSWNTKYVHLGTANTRGSISKMWVTKQGIASFQLGKSTISITAAHPLPSLPTTSCRENLPTARNYILLRLINTQESAICNGYKNKILDWIVWCRSSQFVNSAWRS